MGLNLANLAKVKRQSNGWITARCPICAAAGQDRNGNHLFVLPDGRFGCVVYPGDEGGEAREPSCRYAGR
jgi:hypothetical protein